MPPQRRLKKKTPPRAKPEEVEVVGGDEERELDEPVPVEEGGVLLIDLFGGISGARAACKMVNINVVGHVYVEQCDKAAKVVETRWGAEEFGPVRIDDVIKFDDTQAKGVWEIAAARGAVSVLVSAGFPCKDLSVLNDTREGLHGKSSGLFYELLRVMECLRRQ